MKKNNNDEKKIMKQINKLSKMVANYINADYIFIRDIILKSLKGVIKKEKERSAADIANEEYLKSFYNRRNTTNTDIVNKNI